MNQHTVPTKVDLTNCDREPIHRLGKIQAFGVLVAVSHDWIVQYVSENAQGWFGVRPEDMIGMPLSASAHSDFVHAVRNHVQYLVGPDDVERAFGLRLIEDGRLCDVAVHVSGSLVVIECEPAQPGAGNNDSMVRRIVSRLQGARTTDQVCQAGARLIKALTGFDRVMVYKFMHDEGGEVVAEAKRADLEPFLGLRYPASDIPRQARELYKRNLIRVIADVHGESIPIIPEFSPDGMPIDLSTSVLRSVSPIHIEYLKNMGVGASMSVSIVVRGQLWGLVACHHMSARRVPFPVRTGAELVGQMFSLALDARIRDAEIEAEQRAHDFHHKVLRSVGPEPDQGPVSQLSAMFEEMCALVDCNGIGMVVDGEVELWQSTPTRAQFDTLVNFLNRTTSNSIYATHNLSSVFPPAAEFAPLASGLLAIPISRRPRDYLVFFRKEVVRTVNWAGNPEKPVSLGPNGERLTPRKSFEAWQTEVKGQSEPWQASQIRLADALRVTLLEVVLKHTDLIETERKAAQQRQDLLIAELNHRVRNILGLIRGLIKQVRNPARTTEEFVQTLDERVQALARAHDQLTQKQWSAGSLHELIDNETAAYLADKAGRVSVKGPDVGLKPQAFSALALVMHELTTNSAKYGALCDRRGRVTVTIALTEYGGVSIDWVERDGPPVKAPDRQGFGTLVIERSVTHDLGGSVDMDFRLEGLTAKFEIAPEHVADAPERSEKGAVRAATADRASIQAIEGPVLLVEDNIIIAMDCEAILGDMGFREVSLCSNVDQALKLISHRDFGFAVLDVNLGSETSFAIADVLVEKGVPLVFASGYTEGVDFPVIHADAPRVGKPYDKASLQAGIGEAIAARKP
ncbi:HWE histidine kinase domain-containing protein [Pelagibacterium montanilacus]|uniref:HWE histidine kinase domain-containing protein n=1 Tax=Pelagibacterium montanilacus TaxID=2185280 RepID=UPI000F8E2A57|nr:HWE histidine kinase domain-containing protein [Pelagibacterium montanilacus]